MNDKKTEKAVPQVDGGSPVIDSRGREVRTHRLKLPESGDILELYERIIARSEGFSGATFDFMAIKSPKMRHNYMRIVEHHILPLVDRIDGFLYQFNVGGMVAILRNIGSVALERALNELNIAISNDPDFIASYTARPLRWFRVLDHGIHEVPHFVQNMRQHARNAVEKNPELSRERFLLSEVNPWQVPSMLDWLKNIELRDQISKEPLYVANSERVETVFLEDITWDTAAISHMLLPWNDTSHGPHLAALDSLIGLRVINMLLEEKTVKIERGTNMTLTPENIFSNEFTLLNRSRKWSADTFLVVTLPFYFQFMNPVLFKEACDYIHRCKHILCLGHISCDSLHALNINGLQADMVRISLAKNLTLNQWRALHATFRDIGQDKIIMDSIQTEQDFKRVLKTGVRLVGGPYFESS